MTDDARGREMEHRRGAHARVAVIILHYGDVQDTIDCLLSLRRIAYQQCHVIVVDNSAIQHEGDRLERRFGGWLSVLRNPSNLGVAEGWNGGIRYALEESDPAYVLLLNNDTVVAPDFLSELVRVADEQGAAACGAKVLRHDRPRTLEHAGGRLHLWLGRTTLQGQGQVDLGQYDRVREVDWLSGCCLLVRTEALQSVGLFDARYFTYFEDADWCLRARRKGHKVFFVPTAVVWHKGATNRISLGKLYFMARNHVLFMRKHGSPLQVATSLCYLLFYAVPVWSHAMLLRHPLSTTRAVASALSWNIKDCLMRT
jgi:GT2 family glycosyltransferase